MNKTMTGAEMCAMREAMGLPRPWVAAYLLCDSRRLARIEDEREDVPPALCKGLEALYEETDGIVSRLVEKYEAMLRNRQDGEAEFAVYRDDYEYKFDKKRKIDPNAKFTASWHRIIAQRLVDEVPGVRLVYAIAVDKAPKPWERGDQKPRRNQFQD